MVPSDKNILNKQECQKVRFWGHFCLFLPKISILPKKNLQNIILAQFSGHNQCARSKVEVIKNVEKKLFLKLGNFNLP